MNLNQRHPRSATQNPPMARRRLLLPRQKPLMQGPHSLYRYIMHSLGLIGVVVILMLVFGISFFVYQTESRGWADRQNEAARNAASNVDSFLQVIRSYLTLAARLEPADLQANPQILQILLQQTPALQELIRLDAQGNVIASAYQDEPVLANLFTIAQSNWFQEARAGQVYYGDVQISSANEPYMLIAIPTSDEGVVAARLRMTVLWEVVSDIHFGNAGQAYIIDNDGQILAYRDRDVVLNFVSIASQPQYVAILRTPERRWHGLYTNFNGEEVVGSSSAIPNTRWIIITEVSRQEAFASTIQAFEILNGAVLIAALVTTLLIIRLVRQAILHPVERLRAGAVRIGQGDLEYRIEVAEENEIGQVALAFNDMAQRLNDRETLLKQARDEALEASQFKSRLLANVGHDLRTPINAILGYAEIMGEGVYGSLTDQQRRANERVLSNARRLLNLINSLLDQAQIEAGKLTLRPTAYRPADLLAAVRETMEIPAQSRGLTLITETAADLPPILIGDAQRTQQMVMNLVENAIKFTPVGNVRVCMYLPSPTQWAIAVIDTGPGIAPEAQEYIFEPFKQVDGSPTREQKGVGLGLSIVRQLALLMGGEICLTSAAGKGSTFTIYLPLTIATAQDVSHTDITTPMHAINLPDSTKKPQP